jgi:hypothetical protein
MSEVMKYFPRDKTIISKICLVYTRVPCSDKLINLDSLLDKIAQVIAKPIIRYSTGSAILPESNLLCVYLTVIIPSTEIKNGIDRLKDVLITQGWNVSIELRAVMYHYKLKYLRKSLPFVINDLIRCPFVEDFKCCKTYDGVKANVILSTDKFRQSNLSVDKFYALTVEDYYKNKGLLVENGLIITLTPDSDYFLIHACKLDEFPIYQNIFSRSRFICILEMTATHITFGVV